MIQGDKITLSPMIKDFIAGTLAGVAYCLSGHQLDTIKVRMQMSSCSLMKIVKNTYQKEGFMAFYQGMGSPLLSVPLINAVVFSSYQFFKQFIIKDDQQHEFTNGLLSGMFAGSTVSWICGPIELLKCRLQIQNKNTSTYKGPIGVALQIYSDQKIKGLFKGQFATQVREIPCYAAQFGSYEEMKNFCLKINKKTHLSEIEALLIGGTAGVCCWLLSYPQDIIKTRIQCELGDKYPRNRYIPDGGFISCGKQIFSEEGGRGFWRGFSACSVRAFVANAFCFMVYEKSRKYLQHNF